MIFSVLPLILVLTRSRHSLAQLSDIEPGVEASAPVAMQDKYFADCLTSWEVRKNSSLPGAVPQPDIATMEECLDSCASDGNCTAAEVDYNTDTVLCSHHNQTDYNDNRVKTTGVFYYRRRRSCVKIKVDPNAAAGKGMLDFLNQMQGQPDRKIPICNDIVDIVFIVDVSPSIEENGLNAGYFNLYVKVFLVNYVRFLAVGLDKVRVGMVTFDETAQVVFPLTPNATEITAMINNVVYGGEGDGGEGDFGGGGEGGGGEGGGVDTRTIKQKHISTGLDLARTQVLGPGSPMYRAEAVHLALLLTDGRPTATDRWATMVSATELKKQGVFVQVVGVTSKVDLAELRHLASPVPDYSVETMRAALENVTYGFAGTVSFFETIEYLTQGLDELIDHQANTVCPRQRLPISCNDYADVVLLIDMSTYIETRSKVTNYFSRFLRSFLLRFVRLLDIRPGRIQLSAVTYATSGHVVFPLTSDAIEVYTKLNNLTFESTAAGSGKNLSDALHLVKTKVLNVDASNYRHDSTNVIVVIGDGAETDSTTRAQMHAHELLLLGALIIAVPVTPDQDQKELELVASPAADLNRPGASESVKHGGFVQMSAGGEVPSEVEAAIVVNKAIRIHSLMKCADRNTAESACSYELDNGISCALESATRWFYRKSSDSCSTFDYNGCGGNPNSFSERDLCEKTCVQNDLCVVNHCTKDEQCIKSLTDDDSYNTTCIGKGTPYPCPQLANCSLNCTYGRNQDSDGCEVCHCSHPCDSVTCSTKAICNVAIIYSSEVPPAILGYLGECIFTGAEVSHESAAGNLLPPSGEAALSQPDPAGCKMNLDIGIRCVIAPVLRWYYKEISNNCSQFDFQGCGGNGNNFADRETCDRTCRVSYKEQCKAQTCPEGLECEMIDMSLLCPVETPCPGMTTTRCVAPIKAQKKYCSFYSGISSDYALAAVDISRHVKYVVVRQMPPSTDNTDAQFLWYADSRGTLRSKSDQCISVGIPMQLVKCDSTSVQWFFDEQLNVIRTEKDAEEKVKAIAVNEQLADNEQKISIPKHLVVTLDYLRSVGQQTHEATWTMECPP